MKATTVMMVPMANIALLTEELSLTRRQVV